VDQRLPARLSHGQAKSKKFRLRITPEGKQDQDSADDRFKEAFSKEKDRMSVIDKKFEEAMKLKDELEMRSSD